MVAFHGTPSEKKPALGGLDSSDSHQMSGKFWLTKDST